METLQRLVSGSRVKLEVTRVETSGGMELTAGSTSTGRDGPYDFMTEYDADIEEDSDDEPCEAHEAERREARGVSGDLRDDDDESSEEPPCLIAVPPGYTSSESCSASDSDADLPPDLVDDDENDSRCQIVLIATSHECKSPKTLTSSESDSEGPPGLIDLPPGYSTSSDSFTSTDSSPESDGGSRLCKEDQVE